MSHDNVNIGDHLQKALHEKSDKQSEGLKQVHDEISQWWKENEHNGKVDPKAIAHERNQINQELHSHGFPNINIDNFDAHGKFTLKDTKTHTLAGVGDDHKLHGAKLDKGTHMESIDHKINATIEGKKNDLDLMIGDKKPVHEHHTKHSSAVHQEGTGDTTHHNAANPDLKVPPTFMSKENYPATFKDLLAKHNNTDVPQNPFGTHPNKDLPTTTFHGKTGVSQKDVDNYYESLKKASGDSYTNAASAFNDKIHTAVESHPNILGPTSMSDIVEDRNELAKRAAKDKTNT